VHDSNFGRRHLLHEEGIEQLMKESTRVIASIGSGPLPLAALRR
jgi:hypothetical protein